jgi:[ribosomal protein S18]-alanine N-acetyltransferase
VAALNFTIRPRAAADAHAVAAWRYPGEYSFYNADADSDDLAELLDPSEWGHRYFPADELSRHKLAGFLVVKLTGRVAEIGLGLRPDLTGRGLGESFVRACLRFASATLGGQSYTLAVAAFNRRAITVYERPAVAWSMSAAQQAMRFRAGWHRSLADAGLVRPGRWWFADRVL